MENPIHKISNSVLEVGLPNRVDFKISNFLALVVNDLRGQNIQFLSLNLERTNFITLPGALFIICFCQFVVKTKEIIQSQISKLNVNIFSFLLSIGFFSTLKSSANFLIDNNIIDQEKKLNEWHTNEISIVFPITTIEYNPDKSYFEGYTRDFVNNFSKFFFLLSKYSLYNYSNSSDDSQELFEAFHENIKNIYDHSGSNGFGAIQASSYLKSTTLAFFDIGIGIAQSVLNSQYLNNEREAIELAFVDGFSSKKIKGRNQGNGFSIFKEFCNQRNGILTVRTGKYLFIYRDAKWKTSPVEWFPGTQIVIHTPTL